MMESGTKTTFTLRAGVAIRGSARRAVEEYCANNNIEIRVSESKGMLESLYTFSVSGRESDIRGLLRAVQSIQR